MKKDFSQPFEHSSTIYVSVFPVILGEGERPERLILQRAEGLPERSEYTPVGFDIDTDKEPALQIAKYLFKEGLVLTRLIKLIEDETIDFSLVDDTPGRLETELFYLAYVDCSYEKDSLVYVALNDNGTEHHLDMFAFNDDVERMAFKMLLGYIR